MNLKVSDSSILIDFLIEKIGTASKTTVSKMIKTGRVEVNGRQVIKREFKLSKGDSIEIKKVARIELPDFPILYEDESIIVAEKPAGLLTISTGKTNSPTFFRMISDYIKSSNPKSRLFIVHRLDREVSGAIVFAKSEDIKDKLQENWHNFEKRYIALVEGKMQEKSGKVENFLLENKAMVVYVADKNAINAKLAITNYSVIQESSKFSLVSIKIETGRKNQIRVHMSHLGHPIVGDKKYNSTLNPFKRIALHSSYLSIVHPITNKKMNFESKAPSEFFTYAKNIVESTEETTDL
jgi:23S rRNA pseudouridine1911/1915/1917 synthase